MPQPWPDSERLRFRYMTYDDEDLLYQVFADPYARRFYPHLEKRPNIRRWIEWNLENYAVHDFGLWALELKSVPGLIGDCGLTYQEVEGRHELEIGYHLAESARGNGYATEAARACLNFAFKQTACHSVCSTVHPDNSASRAVAGRVHLTQPPREFRRGENSLLLFMTTRDDWKSAHNLSINDRESLK